MDSPSTGNRPGNLLRSSDDPTLAQRLAPVVAVGIFVLTFLADLAVPLGTAMWAPYLLGVVVAGSWKGRRGVAWAISAGLVLTAAGALLSPDGHLSAGLTNRLFGTGLIGLCGAVAWKRETALARLRLENDLRRSAERKLRIAYDALASTGEGVIITKEDRVEYVNAAFLRMFGYDGAGQVLGKASSQLSVFEQFQPLVDAAGSVDRAKTVNEEVRVERNDGSRFVAIVSCSTIVGEDDRCDGQITTFVDISEQIAIREELTRQAEELKKQHSEALAIAEDAQRARQRAAKNEATLRASEERFRRAAAGTTDGLWEWEIDSQRVWYAPRFVELLGHSVGEFSETFESFATRLHHEDRDRTMEAIREHLEEDKPYDIEYRLRTKQGHYRWFRARGATIRDGDGTPLRMSGSIQDIEELKKAEASLAKAAADAARMAVLDALISAARSIAAAQSLQLLMQAVADCARHLIGAHQATSSFIVADEESPTVVGWSLSDTYAQYRSSDMRRPDASGIDALVRESNQTCRMTQAELEEHFRRCGFVERTDGPPMRGWLAAPLVGADGSTLGVVQLTDKYQGDFSEEDEAILVQLIQFAESVVQLHRANSRLETRVRQRTEALTLANRELRRSNEDLERFAYVSSHDLQEPLRAVIGYCQLLDAECRDQLAGEARTFLVHIVEGAERMRQLIRDLLSYARLSSKSQTFAEMDSGAAVAEAMDNLHAAITEADASIRYSNLPSIKADRRQMLQLFQNLIGNAIKYRNSRSPEISISAEQGDDQWTFSVADNGIGIDPEFGDRIFVAFQRLHTRNEYSGTGIGLAICKKIVEQHGGRIWVEPNEGGGSIFRFMIANSSPPRA